MFLLSFWEFWNSTWENFPVWQLELVSNVMAWKNPCLLKMHRSQIWTNPTWKIVHKTVTHLLSSRSLDRAENCNKTDSQIQSEDERAGVLVLFSAASWILCIFCPACIVSFVLSFLTKMKNDVRTRKVSHYVWWNPESEGHLKWAWSEALQAINRAILK